MEVLAINFANVVTMFRRDGIYSQRGRGTGGRRSGANPLGTIIRYNTVPYRTTQYNTEYGVHERHGLDVESRAEDEAQSASVMRPPPLI